MGTALITGATSGIGLEFAWQLAAEGNDVCLVARTVDRLEAVADEMRNVAGVNVEVLAADLSTDEGQRLVAARVADREAPIGVVVNNAGFGLGQDFVGGDLGKELTGLDVMVRAVLVVCHSAAAEFVRRGYGAIINVSSMTALTAQGSYSAHKAWVRTFTEGLAADLRGTGVTATAVMPGLVHTEFHYRSLVDPSQWPEATFIPAEQVVREALDGARRGRVLVTPSVRYKAAAAIARTAPRWLVRRLAGPNMSGRD